MSMPSVQEYTIVLDLLDSGTSQPIQTWRFTGQTRLVVGRAADSDIVVANPYVSRTHAYLEVEDGVWRVVSISTQQIFVNDRRVPSAELFDGCLFRLGSNGCTLRFSRDSQKTDAAEGGKTLSFNPMEIPMLHLDRTQLARDVDEIANGDFFQNLRESLHRLRTTQSAKDQSD